MFSRSQASESGYRIRARWQSSLEWRIKKAVGLIADLIHDVDTFWDMPGRIVERTSRYGYDPTPWSALSRIFKHLRLEFPRFTFIDLGSGKGRVILAASRFPFINVIGIEFEPSLCRIAETNLETVRLLRRRARNVEVAETDAVDFSIPLTPCVFFLYNPFGFEIITRVVSNIIDSYRQSPREIYLVCVGMSTLLPHMVCISGLQLLHAFNIPWTIWSQRTVHIFLVTDTDGPAQPEPAFGRGKENARSVD